MGRVALQAGRRGRAGAKISNMTEQGSDPSDHPTVPKGQILRGMDLYAWIGHVNSQWNFTEHGILLTLASFISPDTRIGEAVVYGNTWGQSVQLLERVARVIIPATDEAAIARLASFLEAAGDANNQRVDIVHTFWMYSYDAPDGSLDVVRLQGTHLRRGSKNGRTGPSEFVVESATLERMEVAMTSIQAVWQKFLLTKDDIYRHLRWDYPGAPRGLLARP